MSDEFSPDFQRELLEDFYSESDELFRQIATHLAALELQPDHTATIEALYRTLHTFKGNCGIVGLRPAEELAHAVEDALRSVTRGAAALTGETLDLLFRATHRLEQIVAAHRSHQSPPSTADLLLPLQSFRAESHPTPEPGAPSPPPANTEAVIDTSGLWRAIFSPSRELAARGINVTRIRERLSVLGSVASAAPIVRPGGTMIFEFSLELAEAPAALEEWRADGVEWHPPARDATPASPAPSLAAATGASLAIAPSHLVRVDLGKLDELMRIMGDMVVHRSRLEDRIAQLGEHREGLQEVATALGRSLRDLRNAITRVRLVPVAEIFTRLPFIVKDLARETGRKVRLVLEGKETEIDKYLVERLKEPMLHLVRNAVGHGLEAPAARRAAGKPEEGTLTFRAFPAGQTVVIEVQDDGRGIDQESVFARARAAGLSVSDSPDAAELLEILCHPGFSTRDEADHTAGRGVGMAVVMSTLRELGGRLSVESTQGAGTRFTLRLPLTLSIADAVIVSAAGQTCAVPQSAIAEVLQFEEADVRRMKQTEVIPYRDGVLPIVRLAGVFGAEQLTRVRIPVLVLHSERGSTGLVVDRVHTQREVVVRPLVDPLLQVRGISGATELGDGRPVLILDSNALTAGVVRPRPDEASGSSAERRSA